MDEKIDLSCIQVNMFANGTAIDLPGCKSTVFVDSFATRRINCPYADFKKYMDQILFPDDQINDLCMKQFVPSS